MKKLIGSIFLLVLFSKVDGQNVLIGPTESNVANIRAISSNGQYVVGQTSATPRQGFTWNVAAGNTVTNMGRSLSEAFDVTDDNRVVGSFTDPELLFENEPIISGGYWENGAWYSLGLGVAAGNPPTSSIRGSHAAGITDDGKTIAGFCQTYDGVSSHVYPYSWTYNEATTTWDGEVWAEPSDVRQGSAIVAISADGNIAAGWTNIGAPARAGILWTSKDTYRLFGLGDVYSDRTEFICLSKNGKYAGFRQNEATGVYDVDNDEYFFISEGLIINAISNDGLAVGAYQNTWRTNKGFVWSKDIGYMDFGEFISIYASDVDFPTTLQNAFDPNSMNQYRINAISPDGKSITIVSGRAYVLRIESPIVVVPSPKNLSASVSRTDRNKVVLSWEAPGTWSEPLSHYEICRDNATIGTAEADILTYTDIDVDAGHRSYTVQAVYENDISRKSNQAEVRIVDNYNIPFFEDFNSRDFSTNYWTLAYDINHADWGIGSQGGVEGKSEGANLIVLSNLTDPFSASLISKPLDCSNAANVYLTYMVYAQNSVDNNLAKDTLFIDVSKDGTTWFNADKYAFQKKIDWKAEILDISTIATGELVNVRFRLEGENHSNSMKRYHFDNIGISATLPEGNTAPLNLIGKERESMLELAWQNHEGLYGLTHQQTPVRSAFGNEGDNFIAAQSFNSEELAIYDDLYLVSISSFINRKVNYPSVPVKLRLAVFADGQRVVSQDVDNYTPNAWNTFTLTTPFLLSTVQNDLKIGIEVVSHDVAELPIGADEAGKVIAGKGDLYSYDGGTTWGLLSDYGDGGFKRNWCIIGNVSPDANAAVRTDDILGYNVYRDGDKINDYLIFGQGLTTEKIEACYTVRAFSLTSGLSQASAAYCYAVYPILTGITVNETDITVADDMEYMAACGENEVVLYLSAEGTVTVNGNPYVAGMSTPFNNDKAVISIEISGRTSIVHTLTVSKALGGPSMPMYVQRWGKTLAVVNNPANNGGHTFDSYRWYLNGSLQSGSTGGYILLGDQLVYKYSAEVHSLTTGLWHKLCPNRREPRAEITMYPNPVGAGQVLNLNLPEGVDKVNIRVYNLGGNLVSQQDGVYNAVRMPNYAGMYVVEIHLPDGTKDTQKIIVK